jgi:hypothetical protein
MTDNDPPYIVSAGVKCTCKTHHFGCRCEGCSYREEETDIAGMRKLEFIQVAAIDAMNQAIVPCLEINGVTHIQTMVSKDRKALWDELKKRGYDPDDGF